MHKRSCPILPAVKTALILAYIPAVFSFLSWSHHVSPYFYDFFFLKLNLPQDHCSITYHSLVLLRKQLLPFTNLLKYHCILWHLSHSLYPGTWTVFCFLKVFCPYNQTAIIILHECLYTSAPYEPLHRRDCVLFILASWYIKHVNYSSLYIY